MLPYDKRAISPHLASLIDSFVPEHVRANYPQLVDFIRAYFSYLEESNLSGYYQNTLPEQRDIRQQDEQFLRRIEKEIGLFVPRDYQANPKVFYDKISDLWRSKGSQESIETFFRIFLDDPVQIRLPWDQVLIPSDGRWIQEDKIRVSSISGDPNDFAGREIFQVESFASAIVSRVERRVYSDGIIWELTLSKSSVVGDFFEKNTITTEEDFLLRAEIYRSAAEIEIDSGGTGYRPGDRIFLEGYEGVTFVAFVDRVDEDTGEILDTQISNYGSGNTPDHIKESNDTEQYYLEDFLLYEYDTNNQVGSSTLEFVVESRNGSGASFSISYAPIIRTEGKYIGVRGQLSESIVLQDSFFYQKYSYEVLTNFPISLWQGPIKKTVSPAGTLIFGNVRVTDTLDLSVETEQFSFVTTPAIYDLDESQTASESLLLFYQDYSVPEDTYFSEDYVAEIVADASSSSGSNTESDLFTTEVI